MGPKKTRPEYENIMRLTSHEMSGATYRNMLYNIRPGCQVEAESTGQYGTVERVIRSREGVPVCLKVRCGEGGKEIDYISVDRVSLYETDDFYIPDDEYMESYEDTEKLVLAMGYAWDEVRGCYYNAETGDEIAW